MTKADDGAADIGSAQDGHTTREAHRRSFVEADEHLRSAHKGGACKRSYDTCVGQLRAMCTQLARPQAGDADAASLRAARHTTRLWRVWQQAPLGNHGSGLQHMSRHHMPLLVGRQPRLPQCHARQGVGKARILPFAS